MFSRRPKPRQAFFEGEEFLRLLEALPEHLRPVAQFGYYTGWRVSKIVSLTRTQVDLPAKIIRLWPGTTKNSEGRAIKLEGGLLAVIEGQRASLPEGCPWVFYRRLKDSPRPRANPKNEQAQSPQRRWERVRTFYKSWREGCRIAGCAGILFHDLRRTAVRDLRRSGSQPDEAMSMTGHKTYSVFRRYDIVDETDLEDIAVRAVAWKDAILAECAKACQNKPTAEEKPNAQPVGNQG